MLEFDTMLPAVAQGAIGIQCRAGDERVLRYLAALNDQDTKALRQIFVHMLARFGSISAVLATNVASIFCKKEKQIL